MTDTYIDLTARMQATEIANSLKPLIKEASKHNQQPKWFYWALFIIASIGCVCSIIGLIK